MMRTALFIHETSFRAGRFLGIVIFSFVFCWSVFVPVYAQTNINLKLFVYPSERNIDLSTNNLLPVGHHQSPLSSFTGPSSIAVVEDSDYRIVVSGLSSGPFEIIERRVSPTPSVTYHLPFVTNVSVSNINGTLDRPDNEYELWKIWVEQNSNKSNEIYFYIVQKTRRDAPLPDCSRGGPCQYQLNLNPNRVQTQPNTTVPVELIASWNKIYCPDSLATGQLGVSPNPGNKITGLPNTIGFSNFPNLASAKTFLLSIADHITSVIYQFSLTWNFGDLANRIIGAEGGSGGSELVITATANKAPSCNAGTGHSIRVGQRHNHNGASASDEDGNLSTCVWSLVSKPPGSNAIINQPRTDCRDLNVSFIPDLPGSYGLELTVTDDRGGTTKCSTTEQNNNFQCYFGFCYSCPPGGAKPPTGCQVVEGEECRLNTPPQGPGKLCSVKIRE